MTECKFRCEHFGETNQGMVRTNNEDTYICQQIWDDTHILCAAIDGLGGYKGGEVAAELARTTIIKHLEDFASKKIGDLLKAALIDANNEIISHHKIRPNLSQMGCVASVGIIDLSQGIISIAHVGDSRIYQFVNGKLKKLTHDHSLVGYREEIGELSEEDAMNHPRRNVIDKFLGERILNFATESYIELSAWPITEDTQFLFCSDGLTDLITSAQISKVLSSDLFIEDKVRSLIASANDAGGKDNITIVLTDVKVDISNKTLLIAANENNITISTTNKVKLIRKDFIIGAIWGLILGASGMFIYQKTTKDSIKIEQAQTGKQWFDLQKDFELKKNVSISEDSIAKLSVKPIFNSSNSTEDKTIDIQSLN